SRWRCRSVRCSSAPSASPCSTTAVAPDGRRRRTEMPINGTEFLVLLVLAVILIGPERLPEYAKKLAGLVVALKQLASQGSERLREELGPDFDDMDLKAFDPRQYDPRRIVKDALAEPVTPRKPARTVQQAAASAAAADGVTGEGAAAPQASAPFDSEAT